MRRKRNKHRERNLVMFSRASRRIEHEDERRTILTAFNGDLPWYIEQAQFAVAKGYAHFTSVSRAYERFFMVEGEGWLTIDHRDDRGRLRISMPPNNDISLWGGVAYEGSLRPGSILAKFTHEPNTAFKVRGDVEISTAFNHDIGFCPQQTKFALMKKDACLGGHYHLYEELYFMLRGQATFTLENIATKVQETRTLTQGERLLIRQEIAYKAAVTEGSILVGCTEQKYVSPEQNDIPYDFS